MSERGLHNVFDMLLEGEESGWIQMLVFAVLIGLSAVSSFAKQRKQKRKIEREQEQRSTPRPAKPARQQTPSRASEQQPEAKPARPAAQPRQEPPGQAKPKTIIRPGSALSAFVAQIKDEIKQAAEEMQGIQAPPTPKPEPLKPAKTAHPVLEPEEPPRFAARPAPAADIHELAEIIPEFSEPEDLKRAIVYLEILGKPVSMRE